MKNDDKRKKRNSNNGPSLGFEAQFSVVAHKMRGRLVEPLFQEVYSNLLESHTLAVLRDGLLPKMLSGELRVPVTAQLVEANA